MTTPYYSDALVTLYHGDCIEIREWLGADFLLTDPPYGIGWSKGLNRASGSRAHLGIANDGDTSMRTGVLSRWDKRAAATFGSIYAPFPERLRHVLVWEKPGDAGVIGSTTGYRRDVECVFLTGDWPKRDAAWGSVLRSSITNVGNPHSPAGRTGHPHAKPIDLLCMILQRAPEGSVADPFAGSGSTLLAAKSLGRKSIGVELEERYCEVIARRLSQSYLDFDGAA